MAATTTSTLTRGEIEVLATRTTDAARLAELRAMWVAAPTHIVCAGCRGKGRAGRPLVHGRYGYMHASCDTV